MRALCVRGERFPPSCIITALALAEKDWSLVPCLLTCLSTWANSKSFTSLSRFSICPSVRVSRPSWHFFFRSSSSARLFFREKKLRNERVQLLLLLHIVVIFGQDTKNDDTMTATHSFFPSCSSRLARSRSFSMTPLIRFWYFLSSSRCFFSFWKMRGKLRNWEEGRLC